MEMESLWYRVLSAGYGEEGGRLRFGGDCCLVWWQYVIKLGRELAC